MNTFEQKIYNVVTHDALLFLKEGVMKLIDWDSHAMELTLNDVIILSCSQVQIALELSVRAYLIREKGIDSVVDQSYMRKYHKNESIEQIYDCGELKVNDIDTVKIQLKGIRNFFLTKDDFTTIEKFQKYRNKIVHLCYPLQEGELESFRDGIMYYVVRIVLCMLYDNYEELRPAEYFESLLGLDFYQKLWNDRGYIEAIERMAKERAVNVGLCPICDRETYIMDEEFWYLCNVEPMPGEWGRADCRQCGAKRSVIYDRLNIHMSGNEHNMPGVCQKCEAQPGIFECPKCGKTHWMFCDEDERTCSNGHCATLNIDYES